ncbi:hypothetical protein LWI28_006195 [Acer negundo]|uniref:Uncharacterized protein n=1 Tax=Acer negundo TaxID=4023 RepID=A0AAD5NS90_ACENE|nr:hypothetical protein LWI28_006195 [Acer negundo]
MVVSRKPDDKVLQYDKELVCDGPDKGVYDRPDEVGIGLFDGPGEVDRHSEVGTSMPDERVFDGHPEVGTGMLGEGVCEGPDEVGNGMPGEGVDDLFDDGGNGTSGVTKRAADRPVERAAAEENDELVETDYEKEEEDITTDTCVDPTRNWDSLRNPEIP